MAHPSPIQRVQLFFLGGKSTKAGPLWPVLGWNFTSLLSLVSIVSISLAGWSRIQIMVGTNFISSPIHSDSLWGTPSPLLRGNGVLSPDWCSSNAGGSMELYLYFPSMPSWSRYSYLLWAGRSGGCNLMWALDFLFQWRLALGPI